MSLRWRAQAEQNRACMKHRIVWFSAVALGLSLLPLAFAADEPVPNDRKTAGQTEQIIWGDSTNGLRAGLLPGGQADSKLETKTGRTITPVFLVLSNPSMNMVRF